jgi:2-keto-4-pentenoate hydratase/2-oxohepta-3-ene-1,7-dioic acid hydratase in catechol pathway
VQDSNTKELIFNIPYLIEFLTKGITLLPGDVVTTGTPDGVGAFLKPPVFLKDGDEVTVEIDGIGTMTNRCVEEK